MSMTVKFARMSIKIDNKVLTQQQCAELLGLSRYGYQLKESGKIAFTEDEKKKLCIIFRLTEEEFDGLEAK